MYQPLTSPQSWHQATRDMGWDRWRSMAFKIQAMDGRLGGWGWGGEQIRESQKQAWSTALKIESSNELHQSTDHLRACRCNISACLEVDGLHRHVFLDHEWIMSVAVTRLGSSQSS